MGYAAPAAADLSLADLAAFDPTHKRRDGESDCCCPLCGAAKPVDAAHRSLSYNGATGLWRCARCQARGLLREFRKEEVSQTPLTGRERARRHLRRAMALPPVSGHARHLPGAVAPPPAPADAPSSAPAAWLGRIGVLLPLPGTPGAAYVAARRGLPPTLCQAAGARFAPGFFGRPAVVFPVRDGDDVLVAAQGRYTDGRDDPRMRTTGERKRGVFATPGALPGALDANRERPVVLTEAPLDALTLAFCGVPAVALCGCEGLPEWLLAQCGFREVYAAFDADEAGEAASARLGDLLRPRGATVRRLRPEGSVKDWNALLLGRGWEAVTDGLAGALGRPGRWPDTLALWREDVCERAWCALSAAGDGDGLPVAALDAVLSADGHDGAAALAVRRLLARGAAVRCPDGGLRPAN